MPYIAFGYYAQNIFKDYVARELTIGHPGLLKKSEDMEHGITHSSTSS